MDYRIISKCEKYTLARGAEDFNGIGLSYGTLKSAESRINYATHIAHSLRNFIDSFD
jgi:hypothetical protein